MRGILTDNEIDKFLVNQFTGRIGCCSGDVIYVVPVTYLYDHGYVYGHSTAGMKINMMRQNPEICFEVDFMQDMANWQSVIAWGRFEEITSEKEKQKLMQMFVEHFMPAAAGKTEKMPDHGIPGHQEDIENKEVILFRLKLNKKTGRFEKR